MFDFEDRWWAAAVALLLLLWAAGIIIPVRLAGPAVSGLRHFLEMDEGAGEDQPFAMRPPSVTPPLLVFGGALGLVALSMWKRVREPEGGNRWLWMACAGGLAALWGMFLFAITMRLHGVL